MSRDYRLYLKDMQHACRKVLKYVRARTPKQLLANEKTYDAVLRNLEVIGEAAKHIPDDVRRKYPLVEWRKIAGLRDIVIHEYFGIDNEIIWDVVKNEIPFLLKQLKKRPR